MKRRELAGGGPPPQIVVDGDLAATQANLNKMRRSDWKHLNEQRIRLARAISSSEGDAMSVFRGMDARGNPGHRSHGNFIPGQASVLTMGSVPDVTQPAQGSSVKEAANSVEIRARRLAGEKAAQRGGGVFGV